MENKPVEIEFPPEVLAEARAEDIAVLDGSYEPPEDGDKSETGDKSKSKETKDEDPAKTTEDDDGDKGGDKDGEKPPVDALLEGIHLEEFKKDGKPLYVTDKEGKRLDLKTVIEDHLNNLNWKKSNTEKNQALSQREKELTDRIGKYDVESIVSALQDDNGALATQLDEWFTPEGEDPNPANNPFRSITGAMAEQSTADKAKAEKDSQARNEAAETAVAEEYAELEKLDPKYKETGERDELMRLALAPKTLLEAHQLRDAEGLAAQVKKITSELKARNKAYDDLVAQKGPAEAGLGDGLDAKGARTSSNETGEVKSWDDQMAKAKAHFLN